MRIPTQMVIYGIWIFASITAIAVIGGALVVGFRGKWSQLDWRITKLASALLGAVGIVMLLNFENTVRNILIDKSKEYAYAEFVDTKFFVAQGLAIACVRDQSVEKNRLTCGDYKNIDGQVSSYWVRNSLPIKKITNWQRNSEIDEFVSEINKRIEIINGALPPSEEDKPIISSETRIDMLVFAIFLVTVAIGGAVGDAAFQVRLSLQERRNASIANVG